MKSKNYTGSGITQSIGSFQFQRLIMYDPFLLRNRPSEPTDDECYQRAIEVLYALRTADNDGFLKYVYLPVPDPNANAV